MDALSDLVTMRWLIALLVVLLLGLQIRLWIGPGSFAEVAYLQREIAVQERANRRLSERNRLLAGEVENLRSGLEAVEERARRELGMIRRGETFYMVVDGPPATPRARP